MAVRDAADSWLICISMEMTMLTLNMNCTRCAKTFQVAIDVYRSLDIGDLPKRCPACNDEIQGRPDIVLDRTTMVEYTVRLHESACRLLGRAEIFQPLPTDKPSRRLTLKGKDYGVSWSGRIELFSHVWPVEPGMVVVFSHNLTRRKVWYVKRRRQVATMVSPTSARVAEMTRRVPHNYVPQEYTFWGEKHTEEGPFEREEENDYCLLTQNLDTAVANLQRDSLPELVWIEAYSKTTLKGLGAQFESRIVGQPMYALEISGGCRSGRYGTRAMLAVCDPMDPVKVERREW